LMDSANRFFLYEAVSACTKSEKWLAFGFPLSAQSISLFEKATAMRLYLFAFFSLFMQKQDIAH